MAPKTQTQTPKPEPKPEPENQPQHLYKVKGKVKGKFAPDGTPWPEDFNHWRNAERLYWTNQHSDREAKLERDMKEEFAQMQKAENKMYEDDAKLEKTFDKLAHGNAAAASPSSLSTKQTENPTATPTYLCCFCNEKPQRNPTSDYCPDCWNRKQRGEKLEVHPAFKWEKKATV